MQANSIYSNSDISNESNIKFIKVNLTTQNGAQELDKNITLYVFSCNLGTYAIGEAEFWASFRRAYSIIEIVFVIVILGIVASIASDIIVQVYDSYLVQRAVYRVNYKTELAVNEIVNRLTS